MWVVDLVSLIVAMTITLACVFFLGYSYLLQQQSMLAKLSSAIAFGLSVALTSGIGNVAQFELGAILGSTFLGLLAGGGIAGLTAAICEAIFSSLAKASSRRIALLGVFLIAGGVAIGVSQLML